MRKITSDVCGAFVNGVARSSGNTSTDGDVLLLHGNRIAWRNDDGSIVATLAGWPTVTTRERLNGLCSLLGLNKVFHQCKHKQFFGLEEIDEMDTVVLVGSTKPDTTPARDDWDGVLIRSKHVNAEYMIVRVGWIEPKSPTERGVILWQAVAMRQMKHRLWVVPISSAEVAERIETNEIEEIGCVEDPVCIDSIEFAG